MDRRKGLHELNALWFQSGVLIVLVTKLRALAHIQN